MAELTYNIARSSKQSLVFKFYEYKGLKLCDLRKYYKESSESEILKPTQKGITLNESQLFQFVEILQNNANDITDFFQSSDKLEIRVNKAELIGRQFAFDYKNGETELRIGTQLTERMTEEQVVVFAKLLDAVNRAITEVWEEDVDYILDVINEKINRIL